MTTLSCLQALFLNRKSNSVRLDAVLVDDGSSDGTVDAVKGNFPLVKIEYGDGSLFWNRGMHRAQEVAMRALPDFVLWLNDDTMLSEDALDRLLSAYEQLSRKVGHAVIVVGATVDRITKNLTYAGMERVSAIRPLQFRKVWHPEETRECQAMNGNIVLIPRQIVERLNNLDPVYEHAMGDIDYALRARAAGFRIFVAGGVMGYCSNNPVAGTEADRDLPFRARWKKLMGPKGLPPRSWLHFTSRHGSVVWPLFFAWPYVRFLIKEISPRD